MVPPPAATVGVAVTNEPVDALKVAAGAQVYGPPPAPLAVKVVVLPEHTMVGDATTLIEAGDAILTIVSELEALVPQELLAVTVILPVLQPGVTVIEFVVPPLTTTHPLGSVQV